MGLREGLGDRQPQPGAARPAGFAHVELGKAPEQACLATIRLAMIRWLTPKVPSGGTALNRGETTAGTSIVSGQMIDVVTSHCFQGRAAC